MSAVLISDPQPEVQLLISRMVERAGFRPVTDAAEALESELVGVVIESGSEHARRLARDVRARHPHVPIVCVSIYPPGAEVAELAPAKYLTKPFLMTDMLSALREAFGAPVRTEA